MRSPAGEETTAKEEKNYKKSPMVKTYARTVQEATARVIIQAKEDRTSEDVERQVS